MKVGCYCILSSFLLQRVPAAQPIKVIIKVKIFWGLYMGILVCMIEVRLSFLYLKWLPLLEILKF